jgi:hypothetical protein
MVSFTLVTADFFLFPVRLRDQDDDVRGVAAACLLPVAVALPGQLRQDQLVLLLDVLWSCLESGEDDLGSSTASVMDLLSEYQACKDLVKERLSLVFQLCTQAVSSRLPKLFRSTPAKPNTKSWSFLKHSSRSLLIVLLSFHTQASPVFSHPSFIPLLPAHHRGSSLSHCEGSPLLS